MLTLSDRQPRPLTPSPVISAMTAPEILAAAWKKVRSNKGGAGVDGVDIASFEKRAERNLKRLGNRICAERYHPKPLKRIRVSKKSGGIRELAVPSIADRVAQSAMLLAIGQELDARMSDASFGYRPGRSVEAALTRAREAFSAGDVWVVDVDLERYFDCIPHAQLVEELAIWIDDEAALRLIMLWLHGFSRQGIGVAQGSPISPLLSNIYLHPIDRLMTASGRLMIRYADDLIIICPEEVDAINALATLKLLLARRGLKINEAKTAIRPPGEPFEFLGETLASPASACADVELSEAENDRHDMALALL